MKILLIDDHSIVREGFKNILSEQHANAIIEECGCGKEGLSKLASSSYDFVILDISLPDISGIEVLSEIHLRKYKCKVIILSMHREQHYPIKAFQLGACGYITKDSAAEELGLAFNKIVNGKKYLSEEIAQSIVNNLHKETDKPPHQYLSDREMEVLLGIAKGRTLLEISEDLNISSKTVSTYRSRVLEKMKVKSNSEIIIYCYNHSLIS